MGITINAENLEDARDKLNLREQRYGIKIRWRKGESYDYTDQMETGCIVDARGMPGQEVERSFTTAAEALRYVATLLKVVDARAREQKKERAKRNKLKEKK